MRGFPSLTMTEFDYDAQLALAQERAQALKGELEILVLAYKKSQGRAEGPIEVIPGGQALPDGNRHYEGQVGYWVSWHVSDPVVHNNSGKPYGVGLTNYIRPEQLDTLFARAFAGVNVSRLETEAYARHPTPRDFEAERILKEVDRLQDAWQTHAANLKVNPDSDEGGKAFIQFLSDRNGWG